MKDSAAPITQADLENLWARIESRFAAIDKKLAGLSTRLDEFGASLTAIQREVKDQFQFVAELITKTVDRLDVIDDKLDGERHSLLTDVHAFVGADHATVRILTRRVERLEQKLGLAA